MTNKAEHYSYRLYGDKTYARNFHGDRYSGPFGTFLLEQERSIFAEFLLDGHRTIGSVLDAGTGSGKLALHFACIGMQVTAIDASPEMVRITQQQAKEQNVKIDCLLGDIQELSFQPRSFDGVVSSRVLMHLIDWKAALAQLCNICDGAIVIDFPSTYSLAAMGPLTRRILRLVGLKAQGYHSVTAGEVKRELEKNGFRVTHVYKCYFLHIGLHRLLRNPALSMKLEKLFGALGLRQLLGAPVVIGAERC